MIWSLFRLTTKCQETTFVTPPDKHQVTRVLIRCCPLRQSSSNLEAAGSCCQLFRISRELPERKRQPVTEINGSESSMTMADASKLPTLSDRVNIVEAFLTQPPQRLCSQPGRNAWRENKYNHITAAYLFILRSIEDE